MPKYFWASNKEGRILETWSITATYAEAGQMMKLCCASIYCHCDVANDFAHPSTKFLGTPLSVCAWLLYAGGEVCFIDTAMF